MVFKGVGFILQVSKNYTLRSNVRRPLQFFVVNEYDYSH
jgi:hypothetical protein